MPATGELVSCGGLVFSSMRQVDCLVLLKAGIAKHIDGGPRRQESHVHSEKSFRAKVLPGFYFIKQGLCIAIGRIRRIRMSVETLNTVENRTVLNYLLT